MANARSALGQCLGALGRDHETEPLMVQAGLLICDALCPEHRLVIEPLDRLIGFYGLRGDAQEADRYQAILDEINESP